MLKNGFMTPEGMMIEITDRLGWRALFSSQNHLDILGDLRGVLTGDEISLWRKLAGLIQSMCLFVNNGVIFHNCLWNCQLRQTIMITKRGITREWKKCISSVKRQVQIPGLHPRNILVTLGRSFHFSKPHFLIFKMRIISITRIWDDCNNQMR